MSEVRKDHETIFEAITRVLKKDFLTKEEFHNFSTQFNGDDGSLGSFGTTKDINRLHENVSSCVKQLNNALIKVENIERANGEILWEFNSVKDLISQKATIEQLILMEAKFKEYAELQDLHELKMNLKDYVPLSKYTMMEVKVDRIAKSYAHLADAASVKKEMEDITMDFEGRLLRRAKKEDLEQIEKKFDKRIGNIVTEHSLFITKMNKVYKTLQTVEDNHKKFVNQFDFKKECNQIWKNFEKYCAYKHLENLSNEILPKIKGFEKTIDKYNEVNDNTQKIVSRFDEIILQKAAKHSLESLRADLDKRLESTMVRFKEDAFDLRNKIDANYIEMKSLKSELTQYFNGLIPQTEKSVKNKIINSFGGSPCSVEEIQKLLKLKVDKAEFKQWNNLRVGKEHLNGINGQIEVINSKMENLTIIMMEGIRVMSNIKEVSGLTKKLNEHVKIIQKWNKRKDIHSINSDDRENSDEAKVCERLTKNSTGINRPKTKNGCKPLALLSRINFSPPVMRLNTSGRSIGRTQRIKRHRKIKREASDLTKEDVFSMGSLSPSNLKSTVSIHDWNIINDMNQSGLYSPNHTIDLRSRDTSVKKTIKTKLPIKEKAREYTGNNAFQVFEGKYARAKKTERINLRTGAVDVPYISPRLILETAKYKDVQNVSHKDSIQHTLTEEKSRSEDHPDLEKKDVIFNIVSDKIPHLNIDK
ncbi:unnamed protein product [Moneuplotes crassus]|uniref:Uncharacterized protein n=1 Tax=Euplotes crassus TaxID=5936 RepID=A0AAD1Y039_EUPCR|nr:unnamed protein product [Moneuplotes crassus]